MEIEKDRTVISQSSKNLFASWFWPSAIASLLAGVWFFSEIWRSSAFEPMIFLIVTLAALRQSWKDKSECHYVLSGFTNFSDYKCHVYLTNLSNKEVVVDITLILIATNKIEKTKIKLPSNTTTEAHKHMSKYLVGTSDADALLRFQAPSEAIHVCTKLFNITNGETKSIHDESRVG